ncbi:MAG: PepSY domain-containing protein [Candidatus Thiodiazotropha sp. (ex Lucinoma kastoroae)]|nr:PepSY domain-containing protein [Candidatus Thiodiazotropha sp. (ex Lucinoma kastoroae)]MCU7860196.1 PepSY domain-containing protein [Candidatus Thiodiazotropha sp. (ex Lucinoma kastoroae)]
MIKLPVLLLALLFLMATSLLLADEGYQEARLLTESGHILPLQALLQVIQAEQSGRVLEVEFEHEGDLYLYEIEILDKQGAVWEFKVDAASGEILKRELED